MVRRRAAPAIPLGLTSGFMPAYLMKAQLFEYQKDSVGYYQNPYLG